jgi:hypothetical protein
MSRAKSLRATEDIALLHRAIDACASEGDELLTFKEWRKQVMTGKIAELGGARRTFVRNYLAAAEDAGVTVARSQPERQAYRAVPKPEESGVILCGPLPKAPPGVIGNGRRFGEGRR